MRSRDLRKGLRIQGKKMGSLFLSVLLLAFVTMAQTESVMAQERTSVEGDRPSSGGPRRQLATIVYSGLGGAVLGLSTLSFYGRPQDKLSNIAVGIAVGVIVGTVAVTYSAATNPDEFYGANPANRNLANRNPLNSSRTIEDLLGPESQKTVLAARSTESAGNAQKWGIDFSVLSF